jgi:hypothetical protein
MDDESIFACEILDIRVLYELFKDAGLHVVELNVFELALYDES